MFVKHTNTYNIERLDYTYWSFTLGKYMGGSLRVLLKKGLITKPLILEPEDSAE